MLNFLCILHLILYISFDYQSFYFIIEFSIINLISYLLTTSPKIEMTLFPLIKTSTTYICMWMLLVGVTIIIWIYKLAKLFEYMQIRRQPRKAARKPRKQPRRKQPRRKRLRRFVREYKNLLYLFANYKSAVSPFYVQFSCSLSTPYVPKQWISIFYGYISFILESCFTAMCCRVIAVKLSAVVCLCVIVVNWLKTIVLNLF